MSQIPLRWNLYENMLEIEEFIASKNMRWIRKSMNAIVPVLGAAVLDILELNGVITPDEKVLTNLAVGFSAYVFGSKEDIQLEKNTAYLFHARENGIIYPVSK